MSDHKECWCAAAESELEIECTLCKSWVHYNCTGLTILDIIKASEEQAIYVCKMCSELPQPPSDSSSTFKFDRRIHAIMNMDAQDIIKLNHKITDPSSTNARMSTMEDAIKNLQHSVDSIRCPRDNQITSLKTYAQALDKEQQLENIKKSQTRHPTSMGTRHRLVEPKHTIIIEKAENPITRFPDSLSLRSMLATSDPSLIPLISNAKVVSSGRIFVEAKDKDAVPGLQMKLEGIIGRFGTDANVRQMSPTKHLCAIVHNIPASYNTETILKNCKTEFPSMTNVVNLRKNNSTATRHSIKVTLSDPNHFDRLLAYGVRIGYEMFHAEAWIPRPMQCYKCQRYGHSASVCRSKPRCINCGNDHPREDRCQNPTKCANCQGNHLASHKKCPVRIEATKRMTNTQNIEYGS